MYADARRELVDGLGLEPGPELQGLQKAILAHDGQARRARDRFAGASTEDKAALLAFLGTL